MINRRFLECDIKNFIKNSIIRFKYRPIRAKKKNVYCCVFEDNKKHSGLADRFKTVILQYNVAKANGYEFKLYWESPFKLQDYLMPNYNWVMSLKDLEYSLYDTKIVSEVGWRKRSRLKKNKQYHCYRYMGGYAPEKMPYTGLKWCELFNELFLPSDNLLSAYQKLNITPKTYVSVHIRFVNALEKFEDTFFDNFIKDEEHRQALIERCIKGLLEIKSLYPDLDVFVLSDSKLFLDMLSDIPVKTLNHEDICHISEASNKLTVMKTFVDLFFMSQSNCIYRFLAPELNFRSGFPEVAARIGDIPLYNNDV